MTIKPILLLTFLFSTYYGITQKINWKKLDGLINEKDQMFRKHYEPAKVLLLGTFHFNYPNMDEHKIDSSMMLNVLSDTRQKEIKQIVEVIKIFQPTRIYVELEEKYQKWSDSLYIQYRQGKYKLGRNELYQIGYRAAGEMGLGKLYAVDDNNFVRDNYKRFTWIDSLWINPQPVDSAKEKAWNKIYENSQKRDDSLLLSNTLMETFLMLSDKKNLAINHGQYLASNFNTSDDRGPDALSMWWYSRNLRIFNNILKTRPSSQDRILVIFGNGHIPILKNLFESSPEFDVVELKSLVQQYERMQKRK